MLTGKLTFIVVLLCFPPSFRILNNYSINGNPLQYSCLENPMDEGAWWVAVYEVAESDTTE